jgi:hypothetical protein
MDILAGIVMFFFLLYFLFCGGTSMFKLLPQKVNETPLLKSPKEISASV